MNVDAATDDELRQLLRSMERIANGITGIQQLAMQLVPQAREWEDVKVSLEQRAALDEVEHSIATAARGGMSSVVVHLPSLAIVYELAAARYAQR